MKPTKPDKPKSKGGRPPVPVDARLVEQLSSIGCTPTEIAAACNCSPDTLERRFAGEMAKGRENGRTRLRKKQLEVALKGNAVMLIWLGKQMLGQKDHAVSEITGPDGKPLQMQAVAMQLSPEQDAAIKELVANSRERVKMPSRQLTEPKP